MRLLYMTTIIFQQNKVVDDFFYVPPRLLNEKLKCYDCSQCNFV